jgi:hypothetical protein
MGGCSCFKSSVPEWRRPVPVCQGPELVRQLGAIMAGACGGPGARVAEAGIGAAGAGSGPPAVVIMAGDPWRPRRPGA